MMSERNSLGHVYRRGYFPSSYRTEHNHLNHQSLSFHNFKASIHFLFSQPFHNLYDLTHIHSSNLVKLGKRKEDKPWNVYILQN